MIVKCVVEMTVFRAIASTGILAGLMQAILLSTFS